MKVFIKTAFYDKEQQDAFETNYPAQFDALKKFIESDPNEFDYADFQVYFLFKRWRGGDPVWGNFKGIRTRVNDAWKLLNDFFKHERNQSCFTSIFPDNNEQCEDSEGVGVAGGLTVISAHHHLTEADWTRIPVSRKKDFDYEIASTGTEYIYLECKGTITADNARKVSAISTHKSKIIGKKTVQRPAGPTSGRGIHYGVITVADPTNHLRAWFVDPPPPDNPEDPRKYKLLARLYFYYYNLAALYQHSSFVVALINRIKTLEATSTYQEFTKLPLVKANGKAYDSKKLFLQNFGVEREETAGLAFGKVILLEKPDSNGQLFFFGFLREVLDFLVSQEADEILSYNASTDRDRKAKLELLVGRKTDLTLDVRVQVSQKSPEAKFLLALRPTAKPHGSYLHLSCTVNLQISAAGRAFGLVQTDSINVT
jgi:hypothetical protein